MSSVRVYVSMTFSKKNYEEKKKRAHIQIGFRFLGNCRGYDLSLVPEREKLFTKQITGKTPSADNVIKNKTIIWAMAYILYVQHTYFNPTGAAWSSPMDGNEKKRKAVQCLYFGMRSINLQVYTIYIL